jgi:hypothetical protein
MGVDVYTFASIVRIRPGDRQQGDMHIQLRETTKEEANLVQDFVSRGIRKTTAEKMVKQWYKLEGEIDRFYMAGDDLHYMLYNLRDAGIDALELLWSYYSGENVDYLSPDQCNELYGEFTTHYSTARRDLSRDNLSLYESWMSACKVGGYIYFS